MCIFFISVIINIIPTILFGEYIIRKTYKKIITISDRLKAIKWFSTIKIIFTVVNVFCVSLYVRKISENSSNIGAYKVLIITYLVILISIDSLLLYFPIKKIRKLDVGFKEYFNNTMLNWLLFAIPTSLFILLRKLAEKSNANMDSSLVWVAILILGMLICNLFYPIFLRILLKAKLMSDEDDLVKTAKSYKDKYGVNISVYIFKTDNRKYANALVHSMFKNANIFVSSYLLNNISKEEMKAVILHEIGHIKRKHIEIRNLILIIIPIIIYKIARVMDYIETFEYSISIPMGITFLALTTFLLYGLYLYISRIQEKQADEFAVEEGVDIVTYEQMLISLALLNDLDTNLSKFDEILAEHPSIMNRINCLKKNR